MPEVWARELCCIKADGEGHLLEEWFSEGSGSLCWLIRGGTERLFVPEPSYGSARKPHCRFIELRLPPWHSLLYTIIRMQIGFFEFFCVCVCVLPGLGRPLSHLLIHKFSCDLKKKSREVKYRSETNEIWIFFFYVYDIVFAVVKFCSLFFSLFFFK